MKYAIITVINGIFAVASEHGDNLQGAIVAFHDRCKILWNAEDVISAQVKLVDEHLEVVMGKSENIGHEVTEE
jgi:hypothetical protein